MLTTRHPVDFRDTRAEQEATKGSGSLAVYQQHSQ